MAKKSRRRASRASRFERNESGCMRGLISMLDFRHIRSGPKLLSDRKHESNRVIGAVSKPETLNDSSEPYKDSNSNKDSEDARGDTAKLSVKELIEEEMVGEPSQKKNTSNSDEERKQAVLKDGVYAKQIHKRRNKKSFDLGDAEESVSRSISSRKHTKSRSLDLTLMMEELCSRVSTEHVAKSQKQDADNEAVSQPTQDSSIIEQQLGEATKVFIDHFSNEKSFTKDGKIQPSKELLDALHVLNSNKETFLKLLQDPDSQLLLHLQKLQDSRLKKDENSQQLLDQVLDNAKQESFFWRTFKGLERSLSKRNDNSHDLNRIVVLKPGSPSSYNLGSPSTPDNGPIEKGSSNFSFTEFRRRLKLVVVKGLPDCRDIGKAISGENGGLPSPISPSKDHFFIEKAPKPPSSLKKGDHMGKPTDGGPTVESTDSVAAEQRVSNIYAEARKHLAEIVGNSEVDLDSSGKQVPKSLGRLISFPDYNSPICSPRQGGNHGFAATPRRLSPFHESQRAEDVCRPEQDPLGLQDSVNQQTEGQGPVNQCTEGESHVSEGTLNHEASVELDHSNGPDRYFASADEESEVVVEVPGSCDTEMVVMAKSNWSDSSSTICSSTSAGDAELVDSLPDFEEKEQSTSLDLDDASETSSSSASQSGSSPTKAVKELDGKIDRLNQASPVSVLVPLDTEDDDSPPCKLSLPVIDPIQPRQILFEEQILPTPGRFAYIDSSGEDKKSMFEFVKAVVQKSGLTWDELLRRSLLLEYILHPSLFDELESLQDRLCDDPKLIFDLIVESLIDTRLHHLGPTLPSTKPFMSPEFKGKDILVETWERVDWHFKLDGPPRSLDQVLALDYQKDQQWLDLRADAQGIGIEMEETILEELIEETILDCFIGDGKRESFVLLLESIESK